MRRKPSRTSLVGVVIGCLLLGVGSLAASPVGADPAPPTVTAGNGAVTFSSPGPVPLTVTATLDHASTDTVSVDWTTRFSPTAPTSPFLGSQAPTTDYVSASGTLTFAPGAVSATFTITILGHTNPGPDEYIILTYTNPTNASLANGPLAFATISQPAISG